MYLLIDVVLIVNIFHDHFLFQNGNFGDTWQIRHARA